MAILPEPATLRAKVIWPLLAVGLLLGLVGTLAIMSMIRGEYREHLMHEGTQLLNVLSYAVETTSRQSELQRQVLALGGDRKVKTIIIVSGHQDTVFASNHIQLVGKPVAQLTEGKEVSVLREVSRTRKDSISVSLSDSVIALARPLMIRNPLISGTLMETGTLLLVMDTAEHEIRFRGHAASVTFWMLLLLSGILLAALYMVNSLVLKPVEEFSSTIKSHTFGDIHARVPAMSQDELGHLSLAFNAMLDARQTALAKESEAQLRYQNVFQSAMDGIIVVNEASEIELFNSMAEEIFGISKDEMLGKPLDTLLPERYRDSHRFYIEQFSRGGEGGRRMMDRAEIFGLRSDGNEFPIEASISKSTLNGKIYLTAILRDVSELRKTERMLRTARENLEQTVEARTQELLVSERRLNEAQHIARIGNWELDLFKNRLYWSDEIYRMFEVDQRVFSASYESFLQAIHPDDRDAVNAAYQNSLISKQPYQISHRLLMKSGEIKYVVENCQTDYDDQGRPVRSVGTVQDVTAQVLAQQEAERNRELLQAIIDATPDRIYAKDKGGRFLLVNRAFAHAYGHSPQEMVGMCAEDVRLLGGNKVYDQGNESAQEDNETRAMDGLEVHDPREVVVCEDSGMRVFDTVKGPLRAGDGRIYGIFSYSRDVTERIKTLQLLEEKERGVRELNESLERRVAERTAELQAAKEVAENASRAKSEFLSRMSHELRTPMNAILGFNQLLSMEPLTPVQLDYVSEVDQSGNHLLELIEELLDLSRIETGRMTAVITRISLQQVMKEALRFVETQAVKRRLVVDNRLESGPDRLVFADKTRLRQVFINLLSNAVKYNVEGGKITVDAQERGDLLRILVSDTGVGIAVDKISRVFSPFDRLDAENTSVLGAGVGLSVSKKIVELLGGNIGLDSELGKGSTFWVEFAFARTEGRQSAKSVRDAGTAKPSLVVLYVEENPDNMRLVEAGLSHVSDFTLITATTGEHALELLSRYKPDVVLLDINLSDINGLEILKRILSDNSLKHIPVIAMSDDELVQGLEHISLTGFYRHLTKPINVTELIGVLHDLLSAESTKGGAA